jgi:RNA polymerase sigma factor (sigma-70 family)
MNIEKTIEENIGLVQKMASKLYVKNSIYCMEDLIQVGLLNLITSLPKYDPDRAKLSTFISYCVRNSMIKFINKNYDSNKVHTDSFESIPTSKSKFFDGQIVHGDNLFYYDDEDFEYYIAESDDITKKVVKLKIDGKSQKFIKNALGISEVKIKDILSQVKNKLLGNTI